ncbi:MAG: tRNA lysidine(34) synthetase TilS [Propionibacterium sp.]|nr:MAG: tRNA lysidine(34) synthetase TilS [Propionibacterium sp.]
MARRELGPAALAVSQAVAALLPESAVVVGCSGGADSLALTLGAAWAAQRAGTVMQAVVIDHGLQDGSAGVAQGVVGQLAERGIDATIHPVTVPANHPDGLEAAAREARLAALASYGLPVLLGHTLDDQAETVLLGLLRGSGTRSLAGMATRRGPFLRPLLGLRRAQTEAACREWGINPWQDPHNENEQFARVKVRSLLPELAARLDRDIAVALARTADLARADADLLDELASKTNLASGPLPVADLQAQPDALRWRLLQGWLRANGVDVAMSHVVAVDQLVGAWRGQGPVAVPGGSVQRQQGELVFLPR